MRNVIDKLNLRNSTGKMELTILIKQVLSPKLRAVLEVNGKGKYADHTMFLTMKDIQKIHKFTQDILISEYS